MYVTDKGLHPLDQELRALLLSKVAIQSFECTYGDCDKCKLQDEDGCVLYAISFKLNKVFKAVVL